MLPLIRMLPLIFMLLAVCNATNKTELPLVITTWAAEGFQQATKTALGAMSGGRLYALVEGLSTCEVQQCDGTVGYGGSPDETGESTLDALVMDGPGHRVGAVANLHEVKDAARVAWAIMNYTKHTMLVGPAATNFAKMMGFKTENLETDVSKKMHTDWQANNCQPNFWMNVAPNPSTVCGPYKPSASKVFTTTRNVQIDEMHHDTVGMVIIDSQSKVSAGASTNGARFKIPGRVGDSPIPGSGAYLEDGVGGAAATGDGDVMMRYLPSFLTVEYMRQGTKPGKAARKAMQRIINGYPDFKGAIVAAAIDGQHGAACANLKKFSYTVGSGSKVTVETVTCLPLMKNPPKKNKSEPTN